MLLLAVTTGWCCSLPGLCPLAVAPSVPLLVAKHETLQKVHHYTLPQNIFKSFMRITSLLILFSSLNLVTF